MSKLAPLVFALLAGCYSDHTSDRRVPFDGGADDRVRDPDPEAGRACTPRLLSASQMLDVPFVVGSANCASPLGASVRVRFIGRRAGVVEVSGAEDSANYVSIRPGERSRNECWFDSESTYVVSRREGLEVTLRCTDGVDRRVRLSLFDSCRSLEPQIRVGNPEPLAEEWIGGCSLWSWWRGS